MKISLKTVFSLFKLIFTFPFVWTDIETDRHKHRQTKISSRVWRKQASRQNLNVASRQIYLSFSKRSQIFRKYCSISRILRWVFVPIRELFNIFSKYKHINFLCLTVCEIFSWFSDFFYLLSQPLHLSMSFRDFVRLPTFLKISACWRHVKKI